MSDLIQVPSQVIDMKPRQDRSWKISFETRELTGEQVKLLADAFQGEGWLVFKPNSQGIDLSDIPDAEAEAGTKKPSQRLRAAIMVLYKQKGSKADPESFYRTYMEKLIDYVKSQLEPDDK